MKEGQVRDSEDRMNNTELNDPDSNAAGKGFGCIGLILLLIFIYQSLNG